MRPFWPYMPTGYSQNPYSTWRRGGHVYINGRGLLGLYNNKIRFFKIGFVIVEKLFLKGQMLAILAMTPQAFVFVVKFIIQHAYYGVDFRNTCLCMPVWSLLSKRVIIFTNYVPLTSPPPFRCIQSRLKLAMRFSKWSKNVQLLTHNARRRTNTNCIRSS